MRFFDKRTEAYALTFEQFYIFLTVKQSSMILMNSIPTDVDMDDIEDRLKQKVCYLGVTF